MRSRWIGAWRLRFVTVRPAGNATEPAVLEWHGGQAAGRVALTTCSVKQRFDDRLIVRTADAQELHFRAAYGAPSLQEWSDAVALAATREDRLCRSRRTPVRFLATPPRPPPPPPAAPRSWCARSSDGMLERCLEPLLSLPWINRCCVCLQAGGCVVDESAPLTRLRGRAPEPETIDTNMMRQANNRSARAGVVPISYPPPTARTLFSVETDRVH